MSFFGLTTQDYAEQNVVYVFDCNLRAVNLFIRLRRQWRCAFGGYYGLDYNVLYHKMDRMNLTPEEYDELEEDIATLEESALEEMHKEE